MKEVVLALTPGDPEGIGPEITWKLLKKGAFRKQGIHLLCVGAREPFEKMGVPIVEYTPIAGAVIPKKIKGPFVWLLAPPKKIPSKFFKPGYQSGWAIDTATRMALTGEVSALVTGPISKDRLQRGGYPYPGHTEFLEAICTEPQYSNLNRRFSTIRTSASKAGAGVVPGEATPGMPGVTLGVTPGATHGVTMMLANSKLRVSLVTTHIGIKDLPIHRNRQALRRCILQTAQGLRNYWGIQKPKIAVAALNPHAGEAGRFGTEEIDFILPEIEALRAAHSRFFQLTGPFPADTLFALNAVAKSKDRYDAVVCLYHDQGLIPVKLLDFYHTVNVTLGLPVIRTSVDHGVGFDIAGKGIANPSSLHAAVELAAHLVRKQLGKHTQLGEAK